MYENCCILIQISLKFYTEGPINNYPALVQMMAKRQPIIWTNDESTWIKDGVVYRRIHVSLGRDELNSDNSRPRTWP